ncbi:MAG: ScyD/ScyE family protein [Solirubrobacteraceae bacterium]|nr:ScyD/ScyE family protein [Solirubrobacteraceae bacterium]
MSSTTRRGVALAVTLTTALLPGAAQAKTTVVATGIDNPRGLSLAPDGTLYVAAAGTGGKRGCFLDPEGGDTVCFGKTGKVLAIKDGRTTTVASGLLSAANRDGSFATGADAVSVAPDGTVQTVITSSTKGQVATAPAFVRAQVGNLYAVAGTTKTKLGAISPLEWTTNIDGVKNDRNSNPYGVLALAGHTLVADAGANAIIDVPAGGAPKVFSVIPLQKKQQPVPTSLALGPDGSVYVGELALGSGPGKARIWKLPAAGGAPTLYATGFTAITGLAFAPDGTLYVTELSANIEKGAPGAVVKVTPDGKRTTISEQGLMFPAGAAADATGVYVSAFSTLPAKTPKRSPFRGAGGSIIKITP